MSDSAALEQTWGEPCRKRNRMNAEDTVYLEMLMELSPEEREGVPLAYWDAVGWVDEVNKVMRFTPPSYRIPPHDYKWAWAKGVRWFRQSGKDNLTWLAYHEHNALEIAWSLGASQLNYIDPETNTTVIYDMIALCQVGQETTPRCNIIRYVVECRPHR